MTRTRAAVATLVVMPLVALAALVGAAGPAAAHASLVDSDPRDGADLATAPGTVSFTFNEDIREPAYVVVTAAGQRVAQGEARVEANVVSAEIRDDAPAGSWTAAYRVVSVDGHAVTGEIGFEVEAPADAATAPSEATSTEPSTQPSTQPSTGETGAAAAETTQGAARAGADDGAWPPSAPQVVLVVALLVGVTAVLLWTRRRAR